MKLKEFLQNCELYTNNLDQPVTLSIETEINDQVDNACLYTITKILAKFTNLQGLILQYGFIGARNNVDYHILFDALHNHINLKKLDLSFNHVGKLDSKDLDALTLFIQYSELEYLSLIDNELDSLQHTEFKNLFMAIKNCKNLKYLYICDNHLSCLDSARFEVMYMALSECANLVNLEKFLPYHSKERQDQLLKIRNSIIQRVMFTNVKFDKCLDYMSTRNNNHSRKQNFWSFLPFLVKNKVNNNNQETINLVTNNDHNSPFRSSFRCNIM